MSLSLKYVDNENGRQNFNEPKSNIGFYEITFFSWYGMNQIRYLYGFFFLHKIDRFSMDST